MKEYGIKVTRVHSQYPALMGFGQAHDIVQVLKTSPPVFLAIKKSAVEYGEHSTGPLAGIPLSAPEDRLNAARTHLVSSFQRVWQQIDSQLKAKALKCWSICCDEKSSEWAKKKTRPAAVIEITSVREKCYSGSLGIEDCSMDVALDFELDDEIEETIPFELVIEMCAEWIDDHCEPIAKTDKPNEKTHQISTLLDDFPLFFALRKGAFKRHPQAHTKLLRAFKEAWTQCTPLRRSQVRSAWGAFWTRKKWGRQDPSPTAFVITIPGNDPDTYPIWDPALRAILIHEKFVVESPEHEVMAAFTSVLQDIAEFGSDPPRLLPPAIEKAVRNN